MSILLPIIINIVFFSIRFIMNFYSNFLIFRGFFAIFHNFRIVFEIGKRNLFSKLLSNIVNLVLLKLFNGFYVIFKGFLSIFRGDIFKFMEDLLFQYLISLQLILFTEIFHFLAIFNTIFRVFFFFLSFSCGFLTFLKDILFQTFSVV